MAESWKELNQGLLRHALKKDAEILLWEAIKDGKQYGAQVPIEVHESIDGGFWAMGGLALIPMGSQEEVVPHESGETVLEVALKVVSSYEARMSVPGGDRFTKPTT